MKCETIKISTISQCIFIEIEQAYTNIYIFTKLYTAKLTNARGNGP